MVAKIRIEDRGCPLSAALSYVGEWWTILILHDCFDGYSRFDEFQSNIGLSSSVLTSRLTTLVERGVLERSLYQTKPARYEYVLTDLGRSLRPVLVAMAAWRNAQLAAQDRQMILVDTRTGREVEPQVIDPVSGDRVDAEHFAFTAGPAASDAMRRRYTDHDGSARPEHAVP
ncbi:winged helix-turn-helix transcriptional regulator [Xylanimonas ulmi]|uniref:HxlR family transcriptional regulator n=1 Tax=Xylanimonas ulmi TaxID=228973 RepID=A0A4V2EYA3_9MICO|nr:helix-turn-helix domain-containing protein [Xylanibacterium ulmi]RZS62290.1 HxlR family transcriptional regulator [Xylanibacterium ulmi]